MRLFGLLAAWAAFAAVANAGDWAYWRGPEMNGVSREKNLPSDWSLNPQKNVAWVSEIGGRSTPIVMNGRVYLDTRTKHDITDRSGGENSLINSGEQIVCFDAKTGDVLWKDKFNVFMTDIPSPRVGWASMTGDPETGNVYSHSVSGLLKCYTADGKLVWEHALFEEYGKLQGYGGRTTTPLIDEDRLIVGFPAIGWGETATPPPKHWFFAFDKRTGELLWAAAPGGAIEDTIYTNPVVAVVDGVRQLISGNADGGVYGMEARTGKTLWGMRMSDRGLNSSVVVDGKYVYISHGEDNIDSTAFGRIQCIDATQRGDLTGSGGVWKVEGVRVGYATPCLHEGVLYVVTDSGDLMAFDAKDGKQLWSYKLGTVGKGSPVWADGKIYVMEVNGRIHIVKVSREKAEKLSEVQLPAAGDLGGHDECYASPAIANGHIYFVTRDRTICVADPNREPASDPIPSELPEKPVGDTVATIQLSPWEVAVGSGEKIEYRVSAYDENGRFLKTLSDFKLTPDAGLKGAKVEANTLTTAADVKLPQAGTVTVEADGKTAKARVRSFPPLPWKWDMEGLTEKQLPAGWINASGKMAPAQKDGSTGLRSIAGKGKSGFHVLVGPADMKDYIVQADVMVEGKRQLFSVGLVNQRYEFVCKANNLKLAITSWSAHLRINEEKKFTADPGVWYTMKMAVTVEDGKAHIRGKIWKRGEQEPSDWSLEATDPNPNEHGSPGLFTYRITAPPEVAGYYDNVIVSRPEGALSE